MNGALQALGGSALFGAIPENVLEDVARLMSPVSHAAGETVFAQGEPGHDLLLVVEGELEALLAVPGGDPRRLSTIAAGEVVGELSMLGDGRRTVTVRATRPSSGWVLERTAFDVLRNDARPAAISVATAIGRLAIERLDRLHRRSAHEITGDPGTPMPANEAMPVGAEPGEAVYLMGTLFFARFNPDEVATVVAGLRRVELARGNVLVERGTAPGALWIVARGAIETTLRGETNARRLRLAGPGRAVGHIGLLPEGCVERIESRARERTILLEVPWPRVHELLHGEDRTSRRFAAALWTDAVRALQQGERPLALMHAAPNKAASVCSAV